MAKQKKQDVETSSTTLASGAVVHGSKELIDRLSGNASGSTSTDSTSSTSTRRASSDK